MRKYRWVVALLTVLAFISTVMPVAKAETKQIEVSKTAISLPSGKVQEIKTSISLPGIPYLVVKEWNSGKYMLYVSQDCGRTWVKCNVPFQDPLMGDYSFDKFIEQKDGLICDAYSKDNVDVYYKTTDGIKWQSTDLTDNQKYDVFKVGSTYYQMRDKDLFASNDGGNTYTMQVGRGIQKKIVAGNNLYLLSTDGSISVVAEGKAKYLNKPFNLPNYEVWQQNTKQIITGRFLGSNFITDMAAGTDQQGNVVLAVCDPTSTSKLYISKDDGATWNKVENIDERVNMVAVSSGCVFAVTPSKVMVSADYGTTWAEVPFSGAIDIWAGKDGAAVFSYDSGAYITAAVKEEAKEELKIGEDKKSTVSVPAKPATPAATVSNNTSQTNKVSSPAVKKAPVKTVKKPVKKAKRLSKK